MSPLKLDQFELVNVDRRNSLPGCGPFDHDFCIVYSTIASEPHAITGAVQPKRLYSGTLTECHEWMRSQTTLVTLILGATV